MATKLGDKYSTIQDIIARYKGCVGRCTLEDGRTGIAYIYSFEQTFSLSDIIIDLLFIKKVDDVNKIRVQNITCHANDITISFDVPHSGVYNILDYVMHVKTWPRRQWGTGWNHRTVSVELAINHEYILNYIFDQQDVKWNLTNPIAERINRGYEFNPKILHSAFFPTYFDTLTGYNLLSEGKRLGCAFNKTIWAEVPILTDQEDINVYYFNNHIGTLSNKGIILLKDSARHLYDVVYDTGLPVSNNK